VRPLPPQRTDALITAARDAARLIGHPAQRAWALAQAARDAALCAHPDIAAGLLAEAEQAALAEDPGHEATPHTVTSRAAERM
jgi:hypothetical protein